MTFSADWYADPWNESELRYWDGEAWTSHIHPPVIVHSGSSNQPPPPTGPTAATVAATIELAKEQAIVGQVMVMANRYDHGPGSDHAGLTLDVIEFVEKPRAEQDIAKHHATFPNFASDASLGSTFVTTAVDHLKSAMNRRIKPTPEDIAMFETWLWSTVNRPPLQPSVPSVTEAQRNEASGSVNLVAARRYAESHLDCAGTRIDLSLTAPELSGLSVAERAVMSNELYFEYISSVAERSRIAQNLSSDYANSIEVVKRFEQRRRRALELLLALSPAGQTG